MKFDQPRRLSSTIALPPPSRSAAERGAGDRVQARRAARACRAPPPAAAGARRRAAAGSAPASACTLSGPRRGAAGEQQRAAARGALGGDLAGVVARVALVLVGGVVLLVDRRSGRGRRPARTRPSAARRRPAPRPRAAAATARSAGPGVIRECRTATVSPKRAVKRATICGVSAISGTITIAPRPCASAASAARR